MSGRFATGRGDARVSAMIIATPVPILSDNYAWLLRDEESGCIAIVDPADPAPVAAAIDAAGGKLDMILLTHHHGDHVAGTDAIRARYGAPVVGAGASNGVNGASESAGSGSGSGSGKDKDDVATRLVQLVEAGEDALEWLSAQKPQPVVASADVGAKVGAAAFGRADGLSAAHVRLLKRITDGDVAAQRAVLSAIAESAKASADSAAASAAFKALYEGDAVGESAFTSWAESPASSKISNDKTKAALSEFVAWLRSAKPREESDEGM